MKIDYETKPNRSGRPKERITPLDGIKSRFKGEVLYAEGCAVTEKDDEADMAEAIAAAKRADVVVAFVGNDDSTATENRDRRSLALPGRQQQLLDELCKVNKKVIVVIIPSGPTTIGAAQKDAEAIICGWANGQQQGTAIAKVLFGDVNPGGKLNTTWFAADSDLPDMHDYSVRNNRTYMYFSGEPLYPFGYGLSYTNFAISNLKLGSKKLAKGAELEVSVDVTNRGAVDGDEVVQLYINGKAFDAAKMLRGFERVELKSGETKKVSFKLSHEAFRKWNDEQKSFVVEDGTYEIMVGNSSANTPLSKSVKVEGGALKEQSVATYDYKNYDADPRYRSTYYGGKIKMPKVEPRKVAAPVSNAMTWIEYMVTFVDPGFYVSDWTVKINYESEKPNSKLAIQYDGVEMVDDAKLTKAGKATQTLKIPKPDYDMDTRFRLIFPSGVKIESLEIIWPKDESVTKYTEIHDKKQN